MEMLKNNLLGEINLI